MEEAHAIYLCPRSDNKQHRLSIIALDKRLVIDTLSLLLRILIRSFRHHVNSAELNGDVHDVGL